MSKPSAKKLLAMIEDYHRLRGGECEENAKMRDEYEANARAIAEAWPAIGKAVEALKPFAMARMADGWESFQDDAGVPGGEGLTFGDFRRARAALTDLGVKP